MSARLSLHPVVSYVQQLADAANCAGATDRQLLERFAQGRDEEAFRVLVRRHGALVFGVSLRALKHRQDAEDCLQAAFLVLARKAGAVRWQESIGPWLHQVATRLAAELRGRERRRQACEQQAAGSAGSQSNETELRDLAAVVDEELARLPERCRGAILLCFLEGHTRDQAAQALGLSLRTLERRLQEGRTRLRDRLLRRGVTLSAALAAWGLTQEGAVAAELATATVHAANAFTTETLTSNAATLAAHALKVMAWQKVHWLAGAALTIGVCVVAIALGAGSSGPPANLGAERSVQEKAPPKFAGKLQEIGVADRVKSGLQWLVRRQNADGSWQFDGSHANDVAATALALLPLLEASEAGPYKLAIQKGLKHLATRQKADGNFDGGMYAHGMATWAMCEGYRLTGDAKLKKPAQQAIDFIVKAQHEKGGWRYAPRQPGDTSVSTWHIIALRRGKDAGLDVPAETLKKASAFLDSVASSNGATYSYMPEATSTGSMTGAGLYCRQLLGWKKDATAFEIGAKRLQNMSPLGLNQLNAYHHHFATRALHGIGGKVWEDWETRLVEQLIARQERGADGGSWPAAGDTFGAPGGRLYVTTLSLLSLQHCGQLDPPKELRELKDAEVANYWEEMRGVSMAKARRAMNALIAAPNQAVPFLQKNLRPAVAADAKKTDAFIKDLGSAVFQTRMRAFEELKTLAEGAIPYLRKALKADPDVELRRRVEDLLELAAQKAQSPDRLREMRAVQILELIGTAEARELLDAVAQGAADIGVTRAASDALERLGKK